MHIAALLVAISLTALSPQSGTAPHPARTATPTAHIQPLPDEAVRLRARLDPILAPSAREKTNALAASFNEQLIHSTQAWPPGLVEDLYRSAHTAFPSATSATLNTIVFTVMMQANHKLEAALQKQINAPQVNLAPNAATSMGEMTSTRLQMAMDRRSKFVEALSNVMKKIDSTQESIVQNLK